MKARAERANEAGIEQGLRSGELDRDAEAFGAQAAAWQTEAASLTKQADLLDEEAAALAAGATAADAEADKLQARAVLQDSIADEIDARIASGVASKMIIKDDIEGTDVVIEIPGRPPTEDDLPLPGRPVDPDDAVPTPAPVSPSSPSSQSGPEVPAAADDLDRPDQVAAVAAPTFDEPALEPQQDFASPEPEPDIVDSLFEGLGGDDLTNSVVERAVLLVELGGLLGAFPFADLRQRGGGRRVGDAARRRPRRTCRRPPSSRGAARPSACPGSR